MERGFSTLPRLETWRIVENQYMQILGMTEMLLQSQGGTLRLFPYWPADKAAAFGDLRARGAFLVSAEQVPGKRLHAKIHSLRGNPCRLRWTSEDLPIISRNGEPVKFTISGRDLLFDTEEGGVYEIQSGDQKQ